MHNHVSYSSKHLYEVNCCVVLFTAFSLIFSTVVRTDHAKALLQSVHQTNYFLRLIKKAMVPGEKI